MTITNGNKVGIEYTLKLEDGTVSDSNIGQEPLVYTQGKGRVLPPLENALLGLQVGDTKTVNIKASEAYGEINQDLFLKVPLEQIPENVRKVGAELIGTAPDGHKQRVRVHEVRDEFVIIDRNHPLAGEDLTFDVKILSVQ